MLYGRALWKNIGEDSDVIGPEQAAETYAVVVVETGIVIADGAVVVPS